MRALAGELPHIASDLLTRLRARAPRVHCVTNAVAQHFTANVLLAAGAIPSMTISADEIGAFVARADALLVNLGTFDAERRAAAGLLHLEPRVADEERRVVHDLRMLRDEGGERGIGRHVIGLRQQRRVEPQDLADRRRVLIEDFPEALAGFPRVPLVDWGLGLGRDRGRRLRRGGPWLRQEGGGYSAQQGGQPHRQGQRPERLRSKGQHYLLITGTRSGGSQEGQTD